MTVLYHQPVMVQEFLEFLPNHPAPFFVDCTVGYAGHLCAFLQKHPNGTALGIDRDSEILLLAKKRLSEQGYSTPLIHGNFLQLETLLAPHKRKIDICLMDLGVSSYQLDQPARGFSFQQDGPLDMRMDPTQPQTAADIVNHYSEQEIADILFYNGDERFSRRIARKIVERRKENPLQTTTELAQIVCQAYRKKSFIHPATRTFQALRMEVNQELPQLQKGIETAIHHLAPGGRLIVLSFHSGEDRIVKNTFRHFQKELKILTILTKKPLRPTNAETQKNPRSRSVCFRVGEKL